MSFILSKEDLAINFADGFKQSDVKQKAPPKGYLVGSTVYKDKKWYVKIAGKDSLFPINPDQCKIPFKTKCKLYALPDVGHSYDNWYERDNKVIKYPEDRREYEIIARYWSIFKPGIKLAGNIEDGFFNILHNEPNRSTKRKTKSNK